MEGFIAKKKTCTHLSSTSPSSLAIHRDSHSISKAIINKPKIRIIHIFAPEIIKTDVANFRELVQRLTGKPTEKDCEKSTKKPRAQAKREEVGDDNNIVDGDIGHRESEAFPSKPLAKRMDMKGSSTIHEFLGLDSINNVRDNTQRVKEEELYYQEDQEDEEEIGIWNVNGTTQYDHHENISSSTIGSGGGFLERFSDLEGFIEELNNGEFPLLPSLLNPNLDANSHYLQYGFGLGGPQLA